MVSFFIAFFTAALSQSFASPSPPSKVVLESVEFFLRCSGFSCFGSSALVCFNLSLSVALSELEASEADNDDVEACFIELDITGVWPLLESLSRDESSDEEVEERLDECDWETLLLRLRAELLSNPELLPPSFAEDDEIAEMDCVELDNLEFLAPLLADVLSTSACVLSRLSGLGESGSELSSEDDGGEDEDVEIESLLDDTEDEVRLRFLVDISEIDSLATPSSSESPLLVDGVNDELSPEDDSSGLESVSRLR